MMMRIGELASSSGCPAETIRYYEREGLLPPPTRSSNNYRGYQDQHLRQLRFIRRCRALGMSLAEVRVLLQVQEEPAQPCAAINTLLDQRLSDLDRQLTDLQALREDLAQLRSRCDSVRPASECAILQALARPQSLPDTQLLD